jgi:hypothetical protein
VILANLGRSSGPESVIVVSSEPRGEAGRVFTVLPPEPSDAPELPADLVTEAELVKAMETLGYQLNMVGGGSRIDEVRRFYFRKVDRAA